MICNTYTKKGLLAGDVEFQFMSPDDISSAKYVGSKLRTCFIRQQQREVASSFYFSFIQMRRELEGLRTFL